MGRALDREHWIDRVDELLRRDYAITLEDAGLDDDVIDRHYEPHLAPENFVKWFADKYDLVSRSELRLFPSRSP